MPVDSSLGGKAKTISEVFAFFGGKKQASCQTQTSHFTTLLRTEISHLFSGNDSREISSFEEVQSPVQQT